MEFNNETYEKIINDQESLSIEEVDATLKQYPKCKRALAALIKLIEMEQTPEFSVWVDDWECDMAEIVWPEVMEQMKKTRNKGGK